MKPLVLLLLATGCQAVALTGRYFDEGPIQKLEDGATKTEVMKQIGIPQIVHLNADGASTEAWLYAYTITKADSSGDGLIMIGRRNQVRRTAFHQRQARPEGVRFVQNGYMGESFKSLIRPPKHERQPWTGEQ